MSYLILPAKTVQQITRTAQHIQQLLDDGTLTAAWGEGDADQINTAVNAFDDLQAAVIGLLNEQKIVSPFLRYRVEILGNYATAGQLRSLVMNLWGGRPANLGLLLMNADPHHTRIALECIASYSQYGENDTFFMSLAADIVDIDEENAAIAKAQSEEVAA